MYLLCIYFRGDSLKTIVKKWGNSLAVRLPKSFAEGLDLENNGPVEMSLEEGAIVIRPDKDRIWELDSLLAAVTDDNVHPGWTAKEAEAAGPEEEEGGGR
jgi:antitoxin MazE